MQQRPLAVAEQPRRTALPAVVGLEPQLGVAQQIGDVRRDRLETGYGMRSRAMQLLPSLRRSFLDGAGSGLVVELAADLGGARGDELAELVGPLRRAPEPTAEERGELAGAVPLRGDINHLDAGALSAGQGSSVLLAVGLLQRADGHRFADRPPSTVPSASQCASSTMRHFIVPWLSAAIRWKNSGTASLPWSPSSSSSGNATQARRRA